MKPGGRTAASWVSTCWTGIAWATQRRLLALLLAAAWALICLDLQVSIAFSPPSRNGAVDYWHLPSLCCKVLGNAYVKPPSALQRRATGVQEVTASELDAAVQTGEPLIVDVYADWCVPCKLMEPVLEVLQARFRPSGLRVLRMDSEMYEAKAAAMEVDALPTLVFYKDGAEVHKLEGTRDLDSLQTLTVDLLGLDFEHTSDSGSQAELVDNAEDLELAIQTEEAVIVGFVAAWEESSAKVEAALHLLQGRLREAGSLVRVLLVNGGAMPESLGGFGVRVLPSVLFFQGGQQEAQTGSEAGLEDLLAVTKEVLGVTLD